MSTTLQICGSNRFESRGRGREITQKVREGVNATLHEGKYHFYPGFVVLW